ncbi:MAG: helix-turn-helix domain-containing protein [Lachnospiraceae bacterium]|nr:helix-turn-helix domain-containing protein [Lachnospiraceae bacterium]
MLLGPAGGVKPCFAASADRKNESVCTFTLNQLCKILNCRLEDVAEYTEEDGM